MITTADTTFCPGGIATLRASATNVINPVFSWYTDSTLLNRVYVGSAFVTPALGVTTRYYVTVKGDNASETPASRAKVVTVTVLAAPAKPTVTVTGNVAICPNGSVVLTSGVASTYQWYLNGILINAARSQSYTATATGVYTVVTTNAAGCTSAMSDGIAVTNAPVPVATTITSIKPAFCLGDSTTITSSVGAGQFQWYRDGNVIAGATSSTLVARVAGVYTVTNTNANGCISVMSNALSIVVNALPSRPVLNIDGATRFCAGDSRLLRVGIPAGSMVEWFRNGVVVQVASSRDSLRVSDAAVYTARVYNATGCASVISNTITTEVGCKDVITFPDIFSPNGDGINDLIKPSIPGIRKFRCFKVYNRWGNLVFETTDSSKGWDGKFRYADQPAETYIWLVEGVDTAGKEVKRTGMFTLIR